MWLLSYHIADTLGDDLTIISALAHGNKIREEFVKPEPSIEALQAVADLDAKRFPNFSEVFLMDKTGKIIAASDKEHIGLDRSDDACFTGAVAGKPYFKDVNKSLVTGKIGYLVSAPVFQSGKVIAVVAARGSIAAPRTTSPSRK